MNKKVIHNIDARELWLAYRLDSSIENRNKLVAFYYPWVCAHIKDFHRQQNTSVIDIDDKISVASIALIKAVEQYVEDASFKTYLKLVIKNSLLDEFYKRCRHYYKKDKKYFVSVSLLKNHWYFPVKDYSLDSFEVGDFFDGINKYITVCINKQTLYRNKWKDSFDKQQKKILYDIYYNIIMPEVKGLDIALGKDIASRYFVHESNIVYYKKLLLGWIRKYIRKELF